MYEEKVIKFNWGGFFVKLFIIIVILAIIIYFSPLNKNRNKNDGNYSDIFNSNLIKLKEVGINYFSNNNLPTEVGDSYKIKLKELVSADKISVLRTENGKDCNKENSYIKVIKKKNGYQLETFLECGKESATNYTFLGTDEVTTTTATKSSEKEKNTKKTEEKNTSTNKTTSEVVNSKSTTKRVTTSKPTIVKTTTTTTVTKKYSVIFNVNGGSSVNTQYVVENSPAIEPAKPTRYGYTFIGWYDNNNKLYDFSNPVKSDIILIAKWNYNSSNVTNPTIERNTFISNVYSTVIVNSNVLSGVSTNNLKVPSSISNKKNVVIKSVEYLRNINNDTDLNVYLNNRNTMVDDEGMVFSNISLDHIGVVNNVKFNVSNSYQVKWSYNVVNVPNISVNNKYIYGIVYKVVWEYDK